MTTSFTIWTAGYMFTIGILLAIYQETKTNPSTDVKFGRFEVCAICILAFIIWPVLLGAIVAWIIEKPQ